MPQYQHQTLSHTQLGLAAPCAAQHPHVAHPLGPGVLETPSALGTPITPLPPQELP